MQNYTQNPFGKNTLFEPSKLVFRQAKRPGTSSSPNMRKFRDFQWETWRKEREGLLDHDFLLESREESEIQKLERMEKLLKNHPLAENLEINLKTKKEMAANNPDKISYIQIGFDNNYYFDQIYKANQLPKLLSESSIIDFITNIYEKQEKQLKQYDEDHSVIQHILGKTGADITDKSEKDNDYNSEFHLKFPEYSDILVVDIRFNQEWVFHIREKTKPKQKQYEEDFLFGITLPLGLGKGWEIMKFLTPLENKIKKIKKEIKLKQKKRELLTYLEAELPEHSIDYKNEKITISHKGYFIGVISADPSKLTSNPAINEKFLNGLKEKILRLTKFKIKDLNTIKNYIESELGDSLTYTKITNVDSLRPLSYSIIDESEESIATISIKPSSLKNSPGNQFTIDVKGASGKDLQIFGDSSFPLWAIGKVTVGSLKKFYGTTLVEKIRQLSSGETAINEEKNKKLNEMKSLIAVQTLLMVYNSAYTYKIVHERKTGKFKLDIYHKSRKLKKSIYTNDIPEDLMSNPSRIWEIIEIAKMRTVEVSNVKDLVDNIAPYTTIILKPGTYNLADIKEVKSKYTKRTNVGGVDSPEFEYHLISVNGLTIRGPKEGKATILTKPDYGWVFSVNDSENITFENITFGHTTPGQCTGGVLEFNNSKIIRIKNCDLFGCGTIGLGINNSRFLRFEKSIIRDCTYGILNTRNSTDIHFINSKFRNNGNYWGFIFDKSERITIDQCLIANNQTQASSYGGYSALLENHESSSKQIVVRNSTITGNKGGTMIFGKIIFENTKISGNKFKQKQKRKPKQK